ncbi:hypothetical protein [uncultured Gemmiger sp.]|uniref:hypothetical protein n=1 Tax=uncultured Gemmiger sp. TaxID=1623490 RepID=UPI0025E2BEEF|nr:hypothetical protein [uncultured Gemmiger sp.]
MKHSSWKQAVANCLLTGEFVILFFLLCAAAQGSMPLFQALLYAVLSFLCVNFTASLIIRSGRQAYEPSARYHRCASRHTSIVLPAGHQKRHAA